MVATDVYKVKMESARLEVMKMKMNPTALNDYSVALMKTNAKYPVRRNEIETLSIPQGNMKIVKQSLFSESVPRRLLVELLNSKSITGDVTDNPFSFKHFTLN